MNQGHRLDQRDMQHYADNKLWIIKQIIWTITLVIL